MFDKPTATREGFGKELVAIGHDNKKVVMISADLEDATRAECFRDAHPDRFFTVGIAEQDMVGMAAGFAKQGFIAFCNSFAVFMTNRAYGQIRLDVCYNNTNVKIICTHAGVTVGPDGASAQSLEDVALMRVLPNMIVICPADANEAARATRAITEHVGPAYLRLSRAPLPIITDEKTPFQIGQSATLRHGQDVTLIACGVCVSESLKAADILKEEGVEARVINMHTIKPIDQLAIIKAAQETGAIVTAEEHQVAGGLGGAVAEVLAQHSPAPLEIVGVQDSFGQSGTPDELLVYFGLDANGIVAAAKRVLERKKITVSS